MSEINSALYTRQAAGPALSGSTSAVMAPTTGGIGNFLDLLLGTLLTGTPAAQEEAGNSLSTEQNVSQTDLFGDQNGEKTDSQEIWFQNTGEAQQAQTALFLTPRTASGNLISAEEESLTELPVDQDGQKDELAALQAGIAPLALQPVDPKTSTSPQQTDETAPTNSLDVSASNSGKLLPQQAAQDEGVPTGPLPSDTDPTPELAAQLNAMTTGGAKETKIAGKSGTPGSSKSGLEGINLSLTPTEEGYRPRLQELTPSAGQSGPQQNLGKETSSHLKGNDPLSLDPADDGLFTLDLSALTPDNWSAALKTAPAIQGNAGAAHATQTTANSPAAAVVAIHLQQMAKAGESKSLTVQLDPPELGKVQIRLNLARNRTIQTDIVVEKQDTLNLLQKDADVLRQAMADAGIDADAGSLNFSLAQDNAGQGGFDDFAGAHANGNNRVGETAADTTQTPGTSESWTVDPQSGLKRYSIWA